MEKVNNLKTRKDFEKWLKRTIDFYKQYLDISLQDIEIQYQDKKNVDYVLSISNSYPYLEPILYYTDEAFNLWLKNKLREDRILHELCHILTDPLYNTALSRFTTRDVVENERERLTDTIAVIIKNLIKS
jgi:hypothetical protein